MKRIVITGGPSSGKTTLINKLKETGYFCFDEISREIIHNQKIIQSEKDLSFEQIVFEKRIKQFHSAKTGIQFYDRSFIDGLAYMQLNGIKVPENYLQLAKELKYFNTVFIAPFWSEIYVNDSERLEDIIQAEKIFIKLKEIYTTLGYKVIIIPKDTVSNRVQFIKDYLQC